MIVVKVELWSAITGKVTEIGRVHISNDGTGGVQRRNYNVQVMRRGTVNQVQRTGRVEDFPSRSYSVLRLVLRALKSAFPEER